MFQFSLLEKPSLLSERGEAAGGLSEQPVQPNFRFLSSLAASPAPLRPCVKAAGEECSQQLKATLDYVSSLFAVLFTYFKKYLFFHVCGYMASIFVCAAGVSGAHSRSPGTEGTVGCEPCVGAGSRTWLPWKSSQCS